MTRGLRASCLLLVLAIASACQDAVRKAPATLTIALRADVTGFFPGPMVNEAFTIQVNRSVYEPLVRFDLALHLRPALAERWSNPDDRTYRFELRRGVRFSDGRPLTAADVVASIEANRQGWVTRDYLQAIESVRAIDDRHVEIRTRFPYLALLTRLPWAPILPASAARGGAFPAPGTGPYRLERWDEGRQIALIRNPYYWGEAPAFERVLMVVVPDGRARVALVERGEVDAADNIPLDLLDKVAAAPGLQLVVGSGLRVLFVGLRVDRAPFADPRVREALDLAIDRRELSRRALEGRAEPATQIVPATIVGFNAGTRLPPTDRARARALLAAAGYARGLEVRLDGPRNRYVGDVEILGELARQLAEVGVDARANPLDKKGFFDLIERGASSMHLLGYSCESGDAGDVLEAILHSATGGALGSLNSLGLADDTLDGLIEAADRSRTDEARARLLRRAVARATELRAALPLVIQSEAVALSSALEWERPLNMGLVPEDVRPSPSR